MKHIIPTRKMQVVGTILVTILLAGCSIDSNINNSPNAINDQNIKSPDGIFGLSVAMQAGVADFYSGDRSRINAIWTWQMCAPPGLGRPQPVEWNSYQMNQDGPTNDMWLLGYRTIKVCDDIITYAPEVNFGDQSVNNTVVGMAYAYKALILGELAATYGSIPIRIVGLEPPPFVSMQEAYAEVQSLLNLALQSFASTAAYPRDLNYEGDKDKWIAAVHSLKARYFLHMKQYGQALAEANLGISASANNLNGIYSETAGEYSPWGHWALTEAGEPIRPEKLYIELLQSEPGDLRLAEYFALNEDDMYVGFAAHNESDADSNETNPLKASARNKYRSYGDDFPLISYEETVLIKAECAARENDLSTARNELNIIRVAAGLADFTSDSQTEIIAEVLKQKNLELFLEGQSYHDMRRTGTLPDSNIPRRWIYPEAEVNANPNVPPDNDGLVSILLP